VSWIRLAALLAVSSAHLQVAYGTGFSLCCPAVVFAAGLVAVLPRSPNRPPQPHGWPHWNSAKPRVDVGAVTTFRRCGGLGCGKGWAGAFLVLSISVTGTTLPRRGRSTIRRASGGPPPVGRPVPSDRRGPGLGRTGTPVVVKLVAAMPRVGRLTTSRQFFRSA
jgi:hypothetical protein